MKKLIQKFAMVLVLVVTAALQSGCASIKAQGESDDRVKLLGDAPRVGQVFYVLLADSHETVDGPMESVVVWVPGDDDTWDVRVFKAYNLDKLVPFEKATGYIFLEDLQRGLRVLSVNR
jgi:hypothetical protein